MAAATALPRLLFKARCVCLDSHSDAFIATSVPVDACRDAGLRSAVSVKLRIEFYTNLGMPPRRATRRNPSSFCSTQDSNARMRALGKLIFKNATC